jgi:Heavy-metal resistance
MRSKNLKILCFCVCFSAAQAFAQAPHPGGPAHSDRTAPLSQHERQSQSQSGKSNATAATPQAGQPQRNALQFGPVGRWWDDKSVARNLALSSQQQRRMDTIFNAHKPAIVDSYKAFLKAQANLETVNRDPHPDQAQVFSAIDAANQARSALQKATSSMLLEIRREMSSDQLDKLGKLQ